MEVIEVAIADGATVVVAFVAVIMLVGVAVANGVDVVCATFAALRESEDKTKTANAMKLLIS